MACLVENVTKYMGKNHTYREWYVGKSFFPPVYPTLVLTTPGAQPNCASGNQNHAIANVAVL